MAASYRGLPAKIADRSRQVAMRRAGRGEGRAAGMGVDGHSIEHETGMSRAGQSMLGKCARNAYAPRLDRRDIDGQEATRGDERAGGEAGGRSRAAAMAPLSADAVAVFVLSYATTSNFPG